MWLLEARGSDGRPRDCRPTTGPSEPGRWRSHIRTVAVRAGRAPHERPDVVAGAIPFGRSPRTPWCRGLSVRNVLLQPADPDVRHRWRAPAGRLGRTTRAGPGRRTAPPSRARHGRPIGHRWRTPAGRLGKTTPARPGDRTTHPGDRTPRPDNRTTHPGNRPPPQPGKATRPPQNSPGLPDGSSPRCWNAAGVATRPRGVRFRKPTCIRYGS